MAVGIKGGVGLGYRHEISSKLLEHIDDIDFIEVTGDQYFGNVIDSNLEYLTDRLPVFCHFLGMSLGSDEPLDEEYLLKISKVLKIFIPKLLSDHLAITKIQDIDLGHLAPVVFSDESVNLICKKIRIIKQRFKIPFLIENISYDFIMPSAVFSESTFLSKIVKLTDCGILLDLTNLMVNSYNLEYDPYLFLESIPLQNVMQIHLGGAVKRDGLWLDTHADPVPEEAFEFLKVVQRRNKNLWVLIERDRNLDNFEELISEVMRVKNILNR